MPSFSNLMLKVEEMGDPVAFCKRLCARPHRLAPARLGAGGEQ